MEFVTAAVVVAAMLAVLVVLVLMVILAVLVVFVAAEKDFVKAVNGGFV